MNLRLIGKIIGGALILEATLMCLPLFCTFYYGESPFLFLGPMVAAFILGAILLFSKDRRNDRQIVSKEGFVSTGLTWITLAAVGMFPFLISGVIHNPVDAFFESVSGFTGTGASVIADTGMMPRSLRLWRCFTHWIGGMGILVFMSAIMQFSGGSQINLVKAESTGPVISKLVPKAGSTARLLYTMYTVLSMFTLGIFMLVKIPIYDAFCLMCSVAGTGGFAVLSDSCASYTMLQQAMLTIFSLVFGTSFTIYYLILIGKWRVAFRNDELRAYIGIYIVATALIFFNLLFADGPHKGNVVEALNSATFNVGTILTTTGFAIEDCNLWPRFSQAILMALMFCGACAGSTGGAIKITRIIIMCKTTIREMTVYLRPEQVKKVHMDGKPLDESVIRTTGIFFFLYIIIFMFSTLIVSMDGQSWDSTISAVVAAFGNIGPGFGINGSFGCYNAYSPLSKIVLTFDMLCGRLEIYPILVLFRASTWKKF